MKEKVRARIVVTGRVQGVFFRSNTAEKARELGIFGWVKNLEDGGVEAIFEGEKENVEKIIEWVRKGPILANVNKVEIEWEDYESEFENFEIKHS